MLHEDKQRWLAEAMRLFGQGRRQEAKAILDLIGVELHEQAPPARNPSQAKFMGVLVAQPDGSYRVRP